MQDEASRPRNAFEQGVALLRDGRYDDAVERFDAALAGGPDADAFHNRGAALAALGRWPAAYEDFTRALAMRDHGDPEHRQAISNEFYMGGVCLRRLGRMQEASTFLEKAIELRPSYALAVRLLADVRRALGDAAGAQRMLDRALELAPDDPETLSQRCVQHLRELRYADALADADRHVQARPTDAVGHFNRGCALAFLGRDEEALASVERAIERDPSDGRYHYERALLLDAVGRSRESAEALQEAERRGFSPAPDDIGESPHEVLLERALRRFAGACPVGAELWRVERVDQGKTLLLVVALPVRWLWPWLSPARRGALHALRHAVDELKRALADQSEMRALRVEVIGRRGLARLQRLVGAHARRIDA